MRYANPVIPGFYPDPSVCRVGNDYFLVNSSFEYFPGVPIFHSRDLVHWRQIGHCLTRDSQLPLANCPSSAGIYAPTLRYHQGTFYMVTTNVSGGGHFYVTAADPAGPWSDPVWINLTPGDSAPFPSIDPSLFFDEDGRIYFSCTGPEQRIFQAELDITTGRAITEPRLISVGMGGKYPEGPHLYKINGQYTLLWAEGGTEYGHYECIGRSASPWGPFELCPHNPILTHRSTDLPIQATGHADLVQAHDGSWWMVFLGIRPNGYPPCYHLGRETFLAPVTWTAEGWPVVGNQGKVDLSMVAPDWPAQPWTPEPERDDFDESPLRLGWNHLRNPQREAYSLSERPGWLSLYGTAATLDETASPTFVGRRQRDFDCQMTALVDFRSDRAGDEAGLTVFMNERHHYEIALTGERRVLVRRRIGSLCAVVAEESIPEMPLVLRIEATADRYTFSYQSLQGVIHPLAAGETRYLSTEVAGGFTGVYFALYATGHGQPSSVPARFDWFEYKTGV